MTELPEKPKVDVVIVWKDDGVPKVLTTLVREGQINAHMILPQSGRTSIADMSISEMIIEPLRSRFLVPLGGVSLMEKFVRYNAWVFPGRSSDFHFHLVNAGGIELSLRVTNLDETGHRVFEVPSYVSVKELLETGSRYHDRGHGLRGEQYLGLRHLKSSLYSSTASLLAASH